MPGLRRLVLAVFLLAITQGCSELKELRQRNQELMESNENQAVTIQTLKGRVATLEKDVKRWKAQYEDEKKVNEQLQKLLARHEKEKSKLESDLERLAKEIKGAHTTKSSEGTHLVLEQNILFAPGKNDLSPRGKLALQKVAEFLKSRPGILRIDGHTDSVPITHSAWENNFHLGAARALAVFRELKALGVPADRMFIASFGPNRAAATNKTPEGRQKNRRVELLLIQQTPKYWTPGGKPAAAKSAGRPVVSPPKKPAAKPASKKAEEIPPK